MSEPEKTEDEIASSISLHRFALLEAAINSMPSGFSLWDENLKLVLFNQKYLDIYQFELSKIVCGISLYDMIKMRVASGSLVGGSVDEIYEKVRQEFLDHKDPDNPIIIEKEFLNRTVRMAVARHLGVGWMVTHEDVTESTDQLKALTSREFELQQQNSRFAAAVGNMAHGLAMFDADEKLVICNDVYLDMYRLSHELGRPGTLYEDILKYRATLAKSAVVNDQDETPVNVVEFAKKLKFGDAPLKRTWEFEDGQHVSIMFDSTGDGGWVSTHEDVTLERKLAKAIRKREVESQLQFRRFHAAVDNMAHGLAMFDRDGKLVICNDAYLEIYQLPRDIAKPGVTQLELSTYWESQDHAGLVDDDYDTPSEVIEIARNLQPGQAPIKRTWELKDGKHISVMYGSTGDGGWVSTHEDVTNERLRVNAAKIREDELRLQNNRFHAAVGNMAHGLAMYDADQKLVICNRKYSELYLLPDNLCQPGTSFHKILNWIGNSGYAPKGSLDIDADQLIKSILAGGNQIVEYEMDNGKTYTIIDELTDEGGWVSVHVDVTEERERTYALRLRESELKQQNNRFNAAVDNMAHGLAMFDTDEKLVICNDPYLEIYGLPKEFGKPGTSFKEILDFRATTGTITKTSSEDELTSVVHNLFEDLGQSEKPVMKIWELDNGQHVSVSYGLLNDGGWVSIHEDVTERRNREIEIRHLASHDALTNLPNRTYFNEHLEQAQSRIIRGQQMAILCLDLDHFKEINDSLGHGVGDGVLKQVAVRLKNVVRNHEVVARMGGDEFVILVGPLDKPQQASHVAQRILDEFETPMSVEGHSVRVGTSIGIAISPADGADGATLMKNADRALYRSKDEGRGGFHFFEKGMDVDIHFRQNMEHALKDAIDKGQFYLTYSPTLELESNRISSCEAIVNWNHPKLGNLLSKDFVQIAQETGMNGKLIGWVFEEALLQANSWPAQVRLTINLSTVQFGQNNLVRVIKKAIEKTGFDPSRLEVGISEVHLVKNTVQTIKILKEISALGVLISLDEFGKENSSLNNLRLFSFDKINLDSSLISDISGNPESREIAKAIAGLGQSLGIIMNAHGVNKECQLDFIRNLGCQEVQGHLFSAALPQHSICELLRTVELRAADEAGIRFADVPLNRARDT